MIFSVGDHIQQIINGTKTQTRRKSSWYVVGKTYSIQPGRTEPGIPEGRILITNKMTESRLYLTGLRISRADALAEGGYGPEQFEKLYSQMDRGWGVRWAYTFKFIPTEEASQ